jgi:hypothetical protein
MSVVCKEIRLAQKCLGNFFMPFLWADCVKKWRNNAEPPTHFHAHCA